MSKFLPKMGEWKAVRKQVGSMPDPALELYHLADDPKETRDLARDQPEVIRRVKEILLRSHTPSANFKLLYSEKNP